MSATVLHQWNEFEDNNHYSETSVTIPLTVKNKSSTELPEFIQTIAKIELREDEDTKGKCLELFRDWISKYPDIQNINTGKNMMLLKREILGK